MDYIVAHSDEKISAISAYVESSLGIREVLTPPKSYQIADGSRRFLDYSGQYVNIVGGHRITIHQPQHFKRTIWMVGGCGIFGVGARDEGTIASRLQTVLNHRMPDTFIVQNYGFYLGNTNDIDERISLLNSLPIEHGDIVIVDGFMYDNDNIPCADCTGLGKRPHNYGELFWDNKGHATEGNYQLIASKLFELLEQNDYYTPQISSEESLNRELPKEYSAELEDYKTELKVLCNHKWGEQQGKTGAIVMNCNPFTLGHRWLIEQAKQQVDTLIIFVVEEDKSIFPFKERFSLVEKGVADIPNIAVIRSGKFIISTLTFEEYFSKSELQDVTIDTSMDLELFAHEIAPVANISVRFGGSEPFDKVTAQYNREMANILPKYGNEL